MEKITDIPKITELPASLDNCFSVTSKDEKRNIPLKTVFDAIIDKAKSEGLSVELQSERIVFISK